MLEKQVSEWLTFYLGHFIRGLDRRQLQISLWAGDVTLRNLQLRPDILEQLSLHLFGHSVDRPDVTATDTSRSTSRAGLATTADGSASAAATRASAQALMLLLPCTVVEGSIEELVLHIPWAAIDREPVRITIRRVRLVLGPLRRRHCELDEEVVRQAAMRGMALRRIDQLCSAIHKEDADASHYKDDDGSKRTSDAASGGKCDMQSSQAAAQQCSSSVAAAATSSSSSSVRRELSGDNTSRSTSVVEKLMQRMTRNVQLVTQDVTVRYVFDYDDLHPTLAAAATLSIGRLEVTTEDTQHQPCFATDVSQPVCRALHMYDLSLVVHAGRCDDGATSNADLAHEATATDGWRYAQTVLQLPAAQMHVQLTPDAPARVAVTIADVVQLEMSFGAVHAAYSLVQSLLQQGFAGARYRVFLHLLRQQDDERGVVNSTGGGMTSGATPMAAPIMTTRAGLARRRWRFALACVCADLASPSPSSALCGRDEPGTAPQSAMERAMRFCVVRRTYCQLWKRHRGVAWLPPLQSSEQDELAALERQCTVEQVVFLRCLAGAELRCERAAYEAQQRLIHAARERQSGQSKKGGGGARLWGWLRRPVASGRGGEKVSAVPQLSASQLLADSSGGHAEGVQGTSFANAFDAEWRHMCAASAHALDYCCASAFPSNAPSEQATTLLLHVECHAVRCVLQPCDWAARGEDELARRCVLPRLQQWLVVDVGRVSYACPAAASAGMSLHAATVSRLRCNASQELRVGSLRAGFDGVWKAVLLRSRPGLGPDSHRPFEDWLVATCDGRWVVRVDRFQLVLRPLQELLWWSTAVTHLVHMLNAASSAGSLADLRSHASHASSSPFQAACTSLPALDVTLQAFDVIVPLEPVAATPAAPESEPAADVLVCETSLSVSCAQTLPYGDSAARSMACGDEATHARLVLSVPATHLVMCGSGAVGDVCAGEQPCRSEAVTLAQLCLGTAGDMVRLSCQRIAAGMSEEADDDDGGEAGGEQRECRALVSFAQLTVDVGGDEVRVGVGPTVELVVDAFVLRLVSDGLLHSTALSGEHRTRACDVLRRLLASEGDWRVSEADTLAIGHEQPVTLPDVHAARALVTLLQRCHLRLVGTPACHTATRATAEGKAVLSPSSLAVRVSLGLVRLLVRAEDGSDVVELECMQPDTPPLLPDTAATCTAPAGAVVLHHATQSASQQRITTLLIADVVVTTPTGKSLGAMAEVRLTYKDGNSDNKSNNSRRDGGEAGDVVTVSARSVSLVFAPELVQVLELLLSVRRALVLPSLPPAVSVAPPRTGAATREVSSLHVQVASATVTLPLHSVPEWPLQALALSMGDIDTYLTFRVDAAAGRSGCCARVEGVVTQAMRVEEDACDGELRYFALLGPRVMHGAQAAMRLALDYIEEGEATRRCSVRLSGGYICLYVPFMLQLVDALLHDALYVALLRLSSAREDCGDRDGEWSCGQSRATDEANVHVSASVDDIALLLATDAHGPVDAEDSRGYVYLHVQRIELRELPSTDSVAGHENIRAAVARSRRMRVDVGEVLYMASPHSPLRPLVAGLQITFGVGQRLLPDLTGDMGADSSSTKPTWSWASAADAGDVAVLVQVFAAQIGASCSASGGGACESPPTLHLSLSPSHLVSVVRAIVHNVLAPPPPHWRRARDALDLAQSGGTGCVGAAVSVYVVVPTMCVALLAHDADGPPAFALTVRHGLRYFRAAGGALGAGAMDKLVIGAALLVRHDDAGDAHIADVASVAQGRRCILVEVAQPMRVDTVQSAGGAGDDRASSVVAPQCGHEVHVEVHRATLWLSATEAWLALCETLPCSALVAALQLPRGATHAGACDVQGGGICRSVSCTEYAQATGAAGGTVVGAEACAAQAAAARCAHEPATAMLLDVHVQLMHCSIVVAQVRTSEVPDEMASEESVRYALLLRLPHMQLALRQKQRCVTCSEPEDMANRCCEQDRASTQVTLSLTAMQSPVLLLLPASARYAEHQAAAPAAASHDVALPDVPPLVRWVVPTFDETPLVVVLERPWAPTLSADGAPDKVTVTRADTTRVTVRSAHLRVHVPLLHCRRLVQELHVGIAEWRRIVHCLVCASSDAAQETTREALCVVSVHVAAADSVVELPLTLASMPPDLSSAGRQCCTLLLPSLAFDFTHESSSSERCHHHCHTAADIARDDEVSAAMVERPAFAFCKLTVTCSGGQLRWPATEPFFVPRLVVQCRLPCACDARTHDYLVTMGEEVAAVTLAPAHVRALLQLADVVRYILSQLADVNTVANADGAHEEVVDNVPRARLTFCVPRLRLSLYDGAAQNTNDNDNERNAGNALQRLGALMLVVHTSEELRVVLAQPCRGAATVQLVLAGVVVVMDAEECLVMRGTHDEGVGKHKPLTMSAALASDTGRSHTLQLHCCHLELRLGEPLIALAVRLLHCGRAAGWAELQRYAAWRAQHGAPCSQEACTRDTRRTSSTATTAVLTRYDALMDSIVLCVGSDARVELRQVRLHRDGDSGQAWRDVVEVAKASLCRVASSRGAVPAACYLCFHDMEAAVQTDTQAEHSTTSSGDSSCAVAMCVEAAVRAVQADCWDGVFPVAVVRTVLGLHTCLTRYGALLAAGGQGGDATTAAAPPRSREVGSLGVSCRVAIQQAQLRLHFVTRATAQDELGVSPCVVCTATAMALCRTTAKQRCVTLQVDAIEVCYEDALATSNAEHAPMQLPCAAVCRLPLVAPFSCAVQNTRSEHADETTLQISALEGYVPLHATLIERCAAGLTRLALPCLELFSGGAETTALRDLQSQAATSAHWSSTVAAVRAAPPVSGDRAARRVPSLHADKQVTSRDATLTVLHVDDPTTHLPVVRQRRRVVLKLAVLALHVCDGGAWQGVTSAAYTVPLSALRQCIRCGVQLHDIHAEADMSEISRDAMADVPYRGYPATPREEKGLSACRLHIAAVTSVVDQSLQHGFLSATPPAVARARPAIAIEYTQQPSRRSSSTPGAAATRHHRLVARLHSLCLVLSIPLLKLLNADLLLPVARGVRAVRATQPPPCHSASPSSLPPPPSVSTDATRRTNSSIDVGVVRGVTVWSSDEDVYLHDGLTLGGPGGPRVCFRATPHGANVRTMRGTTADGAAAPATLLKLAMCVDATGACMTPIVVESGLTVCLRDLSIAFLDLPHESKAAAEADAAAAAADGTLSRRVIEALLARYVTLGERAVLLIENVVSAPPPATPRTASDAPIASSSPVVADTCRDIVECDATAGIALQLQSRQRRAASFAASGKLHYQREVVTHTTAAASTVWVSIADEQGEVALRDIAAVSDTGALLTGLTALTMSLRYAPRSRTSTASSGVTKEMETGVSGTSVGRIVVPPLRLCCSTAQLRLLTRIVCQLRESVRHVAIFAAIPAANVTAKDRSAAACDAVALLELGVTAPQVEFSLTRDAGDRDGVADRRNRNTVALLSAEGTAVQLRATRSGVLLGMTATTALRLVDYPASASTAAGGGARTLLEVSPELVVAATPPSDKASAPWGTRTCSLTCPRLVVTAPLLTLSRLCTQRQGWWRRLTCDDTDDEEEEEVTASYAMCNRLGVPLLLLCADATRQGGCCRVPCGATVRLPLPCGGGRVAEGDSQATLRVTLLRASCSPAATPHDAPLASWTGVGDEPSRAMTTARVTSGVEVRLDRLLRRRDDATEALCRLPMSGADDGCGMSACGLYDVMLRRSATSRVVDATSVVRVYNDLPSHRLLLGAMGGDGGGAEWCEGGLPPMTSRYATLTELRQPFGVGAQEVNDTGGVPSTKFTTSGATRLLTLAMLIEAFCLVDQVREDGNDGAEGGKRWARGDRDGWSGMALLGDDDGNTLRLPLMLLAASPGNAVPSTREAAQLIAHLQLRKRGVAATDVEPGGDAALLLPRYEVELRVGPVLTLVNATACAVEAQLLVQLSPSNATAHHTQSRWAMKGGSQAAMELVAALSAMHPCTATQTLPHAARLAWLPRSVSEYHSRPYLRLSLQWTAGGGAGRRVFVPAHAEPLDLTAINSLSVVDMVETEGQGMRGGQGGGGGAVGAHLGLLCERIGDATWRLRAAAEVCNELPLPIRLFDVHDDAAALVGFETAGKVDAALSDENGAAYETGDAAEAMMSGTAPPRRPLFLPPSAAATLAKAKQWAVRVAVGGRDALPSAPFLVAPGLPAIGVDSVEASWVHYARIACSAAPPSTRATAGAGATWPLLTVRPMWHVHNAHPTLALHVFCCCGGRDGVQEAAPEAMTGGTAAVVMRIAARQSAPLCSFFVGQAASPAEPLLRVRYDAVGFRWSPPLKLGALAAASGACVMLRHHWHGDEEAAAELRRVQHVPLYEVRAVPTRYGDEPVKERFACLALRPTSRLRDGECCVHVTLRDTAPIVVENRTSFMVQCDQVGGALNEACVAHGDWIVGRRPWWGCLLPPLTDTALCYDTAAFAPPSLRLTLLLPPLQTTKGEAKRRPVPQSVSMTCTVALQAAMTAPQRYDIASLDRRNAHAIATVLVSHDAVRDCCFVSVLQDAGALAREVGSALSVQQGQVQTRLHIFVRELRLFVAAASGMPFEELSKREARRGATSPSLVSLQASNRGEPDLICVRVTGLGTLLSLSEREVAVRARCAGLAVIDCTSPCPVFPTVLCLGEAERRASEPSCGVDEQGEKQPPHETNEDKAMPCFVATLSLCRRCDRAADGAAATHDSPAPRAQHTMAVTSVCINEASVTVSPVRVQLHDNFLFALRAALTPLVLAHRRSPPLQARQRREADDTATVDPAVADETDTEAASQRTFIDCSIADLHLSCLTVELTLRRRGDGQCDPFHGLWPGGLFAIPSVDRAALHLVELHRSALRQRGASLGVVLTTLLWPAYRAQLLRLLLQLVGSCENLGSPLALLAGWSRGVTSLLQEGVVERRPLCGLRSFLRETTTSTRQSLHALARSNARLYRRGDDPQHAVADKAECGGAGQAEQSHAPQSADEVLRQATEVGAVERAFDHAAYMQSGRNFPRLAASGASTATRVDADGAEAEHSTLRNADAAQRGTRFVTARCYERVRRDVRAALRSDATAADEARRLVAELGEYNYALHAPYEEVAHFSTAEGFGRYVEPALAAALAGRLRRTLCHPPSGRHMSMAGLAVAQDAAADASEARVQPQDTAMAVARERRLRVHQARDLRASLGLAALRRRVGLEAFLAVCTLDEIRASFAAEDFQSACALPMLATLYDALQSLVTMTT